VGTPVDGERFAKLRGITQPCLVVNGVRDIMIPVWNFYALTEHIPNAMLLTSPARCH
jgi:pimeloyl-ACP methyl ester carboxylesterase